LRPLRARVPYLVQGPALLDWLTVRDLRVGESKLDLMFRRHESSVAVNLLHREGSAEVEVML